MRISAIIIWGLFTAMAVGAQNGNSLKANQKNTICPKTVTFTNYDYALVLPDTGYQPSSEGLVSSFVNNTDGIEIKISQTESTDNTELIQSTQSQTSDWQPCEIQNAPAYQYRKTDKNNDIETLGLLYLGETNPILLTATYPIETKADKVQALKTALLSLKRTTHGDENSAYSLTTEGYKCQRIGQMLTTYSKTGDVNKEREGHHLSYFQVLTEKNDMSEGSRKKKANDLVRSTLGDSCSIESTEKIEINGLKGYEYRSEQKDKMTQQIVAKGYMTVVYSENRLFYFTAYTNNDIENQLAQFERIAKSLKQK